MSSTGAWASDVRISMPLPPTQPRRVSMFGFAMTDGGMAADISEVDYARLATPTYAPENFGQEEVYEDDDLDDLSDADVRQF